MTTAPYEGPVPTFTQGDRLRKARELTGMKQREFGELIGVSHQTVTNAEKQHRSVRKITLNAWAMATGVPLEWLETGKAPRQKPGGDACGIRDSNPEPADVKHLHSYQHKRASPTRRRAA